MKEGPVSNSSITLRETIINDLDALFAYQMDDEAGHMAAFVNENWKDKNAYLTKWNKLLTDKTITIKTVLLDDKVVGSVLIWHLNGDPQIAYGLGKEFWSRGIATNALQQFLAIVPERPLFGRVAFDNIGSIKVLTKCGFRKINEERSFAYARQKEIVEMVFILEG